MACWVSRGCVASRAPSTDPSCLLWSFPTSSLLSFQLRIWWHRNLTDFLTLAASSSYLPGTGVNGDPGEKGRCSYQLHVRDRISGGSN